jgi:hypothetical protein
LTLDKIKPGLGSLKQGGNSMDKLSWLKDLIRADQEMEDSGVVDPTAGYNPDAEILEETTTFLNDLKDTFIEMVSAFNQMKANPQGRIKIYSISKTHADFMLFRNGYKAVFTMKEPGRVGVSFSHVGNSLFIPGKEQQQILVQEDYLESQTGAFGKITWNFQGYQINIDHMVKYYLTRFIRESVK